MSLKAKIEAVIYASEEPVTLQQLVGLLGQEAQAELDDADALQGQLSLLETETVVLVEEVEPGDQDALNAETLGAEDFAAVEPAEEVADATDSSTEETASQAADSEAADSEATWAEEAPTPPPQADVPPAAETPLDANGSDIPLAGEPGSLAGTDAGTDAQAAEPQAQAPTPAEIRAHERRLRDYMRSVLEALIAEYRDNDRGLEIREIAGGFRFATKPEYHDAVRGFVRSLKPPLKLSLQALETLAVVAYKQPVTAPEVSEIRGVDSGGVLGSLMTRKLVTTAGRKQVIGRPILYKTTKEFLLRFGLKDLSELPSIEEFERMAGELNEAVQEEIPMEQGPENLKPGQPVGDAPRAVQPMRHEHHAQGDGTPNGDTEATEDTDSEVTSEEGLTPAPDAPGEFTGDETVPPADNVLIDGRISGLPPSYDEPGDEQIDSPALDAEIQAQETGNPQGEE